MSGIAAFVVCVTDWGIPLVTEPSKPLPHYWKIPGGAGEGKETPKQSGVREFMEEVGGCDLREDDLTLIKEEPARNHIRHFFLARRSLVDPKTRGDEGEVIEVFRPDRVEEMLERGEILPGHREILRSVLATLA